MPDPILMSLLRINRRRMMDMRKALVPYKYSGTMHLIVLYIDKVPGASQEEIVCFHGLDKGSVARDAKKLEDMGHIYREISPEDRRQYRLYLTEEGKAFLPMIRKVHDEFGERLASGMTEAEREQLEKLLAKVEEGLN